MKFVEKRSVADPEAAARKLLELANADCQMMPSLSRAVAAPMRFLRQV